MNVVLDACTIINLINGEVLQKVSQLPGYVLYVGDNLLEQEILDQAQKLYIELLVSSNQIIVLQSNISLAEFISLKSKYDLGDGETECLALCKNNNYAIASDDLKARKCSAKELTEQNVIGSLFLMRESVRNHLLSCEDAKTAFSMIMSKGGHLPKVDENYLCS
jgi:predicted nucleic acid-binding protein